MGERDERDERMSERDERGRFVPGGVRGVEIREAMSGEKGVVFGAAEGELLPY